MPVEPARHGYYYRWRETFPQGDMNAASGLISSASPQVAANRIGPALAEFIV